MVKWYVPPSLLSLELVLLYKLPKQFLQKWDSAIEELQPSWLFDKFSPIANMEVRIKQSTTDRDYSNQKSLGMIAAIISLIYVMRGYVTHQDNFFSLENGAIIWLWKFPYSAKE